MKLIDEKVIEEAAKEYTQDAFWNIAFITGANFAQQQLYPFIVEFEEFCSSVERNSLTGLYWFNLKHLTTQQLLEEFINSKTK